MKKILGRAFSSRIGSFIVAAVIFVSCTAASAGIDESFNGDLLRLINAERSKVGAPPVSMSLTLNRAAQIRAIELMTSNSHTRPNGTSCFTVLGEVTNYIFNKTAENISTGQKTALSVMRSWMDSPTHRDNILNKDYTRVGVAAYVPEKSDLNPLGHPIYWVQMFADSAPDQPFVPSPGSGSLLYGLSQIWRKGFSHANGLTFIVAAKPDDIVDVRLDSQPFDTINWIKSDAEPQYDGSASVLVRDYYLNSADVGSHRLTLVISPDIPIDTNFIIIDARTDLSSYILIADPVWSNSSGSGLPVSVNAMESWQLAAVICDSKLLVKDEDYKISGGAGSFTVSLEPSYLNTLAKGTHEITLAMSNGEARATFVVESDPATRGSSGGGCTVGAAALCLAPLALRRRRA